jgi:hypothetical protein
MKQALLPCRARTLLALCLFACALPAAVAGDSGLLPLERVRNGDIGGLLMVEASVGGERGHWLLDTGSSEHLIGAALADRLHLEGGASVTLRTPVGAQRGRRLTLPELRLGDAVQAAVPAVRVDLQPLVGALGVDVDGVLGAPLLAGRLLRLDLARQTLSLQAEPPAATCREPAQRVELANHRGMPLLRLDSAFGKGESHLLDTGNPGALVRLATADAAGGDGLPIDVPGASAPLRLSRLPEVRIGPLRREQVPLARLPGTTLREALPASIVGSAGVALFDGAVLAIDLDARLLCIEALPAAAALPGGYGLLLAQGPLAPRIAGVLPGSPAALAGLQASDEIVTLDGRAVPHTLPLLWRAIAMRGALEMEIRRGGATQRTRLERAYFLPLANR